MPDFERYQRQMILSEVGPAGQEKLAAAKILIIGMGGLGSPAAEYLARAGVGTGIGTLGLMDGDHVELSNLHRQGLYSDGDVGRLKTDAAAERLQAINSATKMTPLPHHATAETLPGALLDYDLVIDGTDTFAAKYLINDACVLARKPLAMASVHQFKGMASLFTPPDGPCYRCLYPEPPASDALPPCSEAGVLGTVPALFGTLLASESIKHILQIGESLAGRVLTWNLLTLEQKTYRLERDPACPSCGVNPRITNLRKEEPMFFQSPPKNSAISPEDGLMYKDVKENLSDYVLADVRPTEFFDQGHLPTAISTPLQQLDQYLDQIPNDKPVLFYCQKGISCQKACAVFKESGHDNVYFLRDGYADLAEIS